MTANRASTVVTGVGWLAAEPFVRALSGGPTAPAEAAPEITGFETPEDAPTFGFELIDFRIEDHLPHLKTYVDRTSALALAAAKQALQSAGLLEREARPAGVEIGCAYATTFGCLEAMGIFWKKVKSSNPKFAPPLPFTHGYANSPSSLICIEYGLKGSAATFSGQETSGAEALLFAVDQIATGAAQIVLVCASESLTRPIQAHLLAGGRLSRTGQLGLWSDTNDGIVPGEGAACWVVESEASARARGRTPHMRIPGIHLASGNRALADAVGRVGPVDKPVLVCATAPTAKQTEDEERAIVRALPFSDQASVVAPKLLTGEVFSAAPLLAGILAANLKPDQPGVLPVAALPSTEAFRTALLLTQDPNGTAGAVHLVF